MMVQFVANQEKINFNFHSAGGLDSYGAMSFEKYIVDLEILDRIEYYLADLNSDEAHLAVDVIQQVGPGGEYLTQMHTAMHCRTAPFATQISLQGALPTGADPDAALRDKVNRRLDTLLAAYQGPTLPPETMDRLDTIMESLGVDPAGIRNRIAEADQTDTDRTE